MFAFGTPASTNRKLTELSMALVVIRPIFGTGT
jgi:hypothetical protein